MERSVRSVSLFVIMIKSITSANNSDVLLPDPPAPWMDGTNVCRTIPRVRTIEESVLEAITTCSVHLRLHAYCWKKSALDKQQAIIVEIVYRCCWGFEKARDGCVPRTNEIQTMDKLFDLRATNLSAEIKVAGMERFYNFQRAITLFVPINHDGANTDENRVKALLYHTLKYRFDIEYNYSILRTGIDKQNMIRMSVYPPPTRDWIWVGTACANGVPIRQPNVYTKNAILHVTDRSLPPIESNMEEIIRLNRELRDFYDLSRQFGVLPYYHKENITLLVPITGDYNVPLKNLSDWFHRRCAGQNLESSFILSGTWCSPILNKYPGAFESITGEVFNIEDYEFKKNGDIPATNGIVLPISRMETPERVRLVMDVLNQFEPDFMELVTAIGMRDEVTSNVHSFFIPKLEHMEHMYKSDDKLQFEDEIRYMISRDFSRRRDITNDLTMEAHYGVPPTELKFKVYKRFNDRTDGVTVNCVRVNNIVRGCNASIYQMDAPMKYQKNVILYDFFEKSTDVKLFYEAMKRLRRRETLIKGDVTLFVVNDQEKFFSEFPGASYEILDFVFKSQLCCEFADSGRLMAVKSISNKTVHWGSNGKLRMPPYEFLFGITECDILIRPQIVLHRINAIHYSDLPGGRNEAEEGAIDEGATKNPLSDNRTCSGEGRCGKQ